MAPSATTRAEFLRGAAAGGAGLALGATMSGGSAVAAAAALPRDRFGALVTGPRVLRRGRRAGLLAGRTFVAKDLFDVARLPTGAGCPEWAATHAVPRRSAPAVLRLVRAGADLVGKSVTDELAFSLSGADSRQGAPRNPRAPERVPGGSSSGSAVAVASGLADLALGTDTGGSVRVPAAYCGIVGLRTSHGRISRAGLVPLAPSFDTVGVFARRAGLAALAAEALLEDEPADWAPSTLLVAADAFATSDPATARALQPAVSAVARILGRRREVTLAPAPDTLDARNAAFRDIQGFEAWREHGEWITRVAPALGPGVAGRFKYASTVSAAQHATASALRERVRRATVELLGARAVLCLPAAADPAPPRDLPAAQVDAIRGRSLKLLCTAGLAGAPCLVLPAATVAGAPVGLALVGPPGGDEALLALGARAERALRGG